ncbi:hypothetical protein HYV79_00790 [Candidatus Woesearchaeota archaeon]|nr:hypothetical protein [Candidatus Woesearchaeota archaeon]
MPALKSVLETLKAEVQLLKSTVQNDKDIGKSRITALKVILVDLSNAIEDYRTAVASDNVVLVKAEEKHNLLMYLIPLLEKPFEKKEVLDRIKMLLS